MSPCSLIASLDFVSIPKTIWEALSHPGWHDEMLEKIHTLDKNDTRNLVDLLVGQQAIGCKWAFMVKINPNGSMARLKARLVLKGNAQTYGVDYSNTLSCGKTHNCSSIHLTNRFS